MIGCKFEKISKYTNDEALMLPERKTVSSAGYDFMVAEDTVVPSYFTRVDDLIVKYEEDYNTYFSTPCVSLDQLGALTKATGIKPTLVPTGIKAKIPEDMYLELSVRSSCPLKYWLILANGSGKIDADYYNNPDNEGHIYFQIINLSPFDVLIPKGSIIGQGIFYKYYTTEDDAAEGARLGGFGSTS